MTRGSARTALLLLAVAHAHAPGWCHPTPPAARSSPAPPTPPTLPAARAPEEGDLFEGDIILHPDEEAAAKAAGGGGARGGRNLVTSRRQLWPGGVVVFDWGPEFTNHTQRNMVLSALWDIEVLSCVRFVRRTNQKTYLLLRNTRSGCAAPVGYVPIGRPIDVFLGQPGCQRRGTVQHEFLHTLGFWHEHTRPDRDNHVTVHWRNILPGLEFNFSARPAKDVQYLRMPYDYDSVMHYRSLAFSKDGRSHTLVPRVRGAIRRIGQRERFSKIDLAKVNILYNCPPPYYRGEDVHVKDALLAPPASPGDPDVTETPEAATEEAATWPGPLPLPIDTPAPPEASPPPAAPSTPPSPPQAPPATLAA